MSQRMFTSGLISLLALGVLCGCNKRTPMSSQRIEWPSLAGYARLSGRAATEEDVREGAAVFAVGAGGRTAGRPLGITLPQYAFHVDQKTQKRAPCIIIQAEEAQGMQLIGCRELPAGRSAVGLLAEFELLGSIPPKHP
jgi:hypothetical protein